MKENISKLLLYRFFMLGMCGPCGRRLFKKKTVSILSLLFNINVRVSSPVASSQSVITGAGQFKEGTTLTKLH